MSAPRDLLPRASLLRAFVVEDEWPARNYLVELIEASGLARVVGAVGTAHDARQALLEAHGMTLVEGGRSEGSRVHDHERWRTDVVFLDVELARGDREGL